MRRGLLATAKPAPAPPSATAAPDPSEEENFHTHEPDVGRMTRVATGLGCVFGHFVQKRFHGICQHEMEHLKTYENNRDDHDKVPTGFYKVKATIEINATVFPHVKLRIGHAIFKRVIVDVNFKM